MTLDHDSYEALLFGVVYQHLRLELKQNQPSVCNSVKKSQAWLSSVEHGHVKLVDVQKQSSKLSKAIKVTQKDLEERCREVDKMAEQIARLGIIDVLAKSKRSRSNWWEEIEEAASETAVSHLLKIATLLVPIKRRS